MSNNKQIRLISLGVTSYAGINKKSKAEIESPVKADITEEMKGVDPDNGIFIVFPDGFRYQVNSGDQGVGKTSLNACLLEATGNLLPPNAINSIDNDKKFSLKLIGLDGLLYNIRGTKSQYIIERIETEEDGSPKINDKGREQKLIISEPKSAIKRIVGPAGIAPDWLRDMKPADQVTWLRSLYSLDPEVLKEEIKLKQDYEKNYKERTFAGNEHKRYKALVEGTSYFTDQPKWQKYFTETTFEKLEEAYKDIQEKYNEYTRYEGNLRSVRENNLPAAEKAVQQVDQDILTIEDQIKELQKKLEAKHNEKQEKTVFLNQVKEKVVNAEKWISDNKTRVADYEGQTDKILEASNFKANKQTWDILMENQRQMNHYHDEYVRLANRLTAIAEQKQKFIESFSPKIEGFEVCIPDNDDKREGLFYLGKPLDHLAESELWQMCLQLWAQLKVKMVFVENISSLGTGAIDMFNQFIDNGGYVFATMMNRSEKNLKITFLNKIDS